MILISRDYQSVILDAELGPTDGEEVAIFFYCGGIATLIIGYCEYDRPVRQCPRGGPMKKLLLASITLAAQIASPAAAADLPVKTYAPPPAPAIYSWWTGCYLGGNVGGAWSRPHYTYNNAVVV